MQVIFFLWNNYRLGNILLESLKVWKHPLTTNVFKNKNAIIFNLPFKSNETRNPFSNMRNNVYVCFFLFSMFRIWYQLYRNRFRLDFRLAVAQYIAKWRKKNKLIEISPENKNNTKYATCLFYISSILVKKNSLIKLKLHTMMKKEKQY